MSIADQIRDMLEPYIVDLGVAESVIALAEAHESALVAAAYEDAARTGADAVSEYWKEERKPIDQRKYGSSGISGSVMKAILARVPADARAALDRIEAELRAERDAALARERALLDSNEVNRQAVLDANAAHQKQVDGLRAEVERLTEALASAATQLARVHDDAFRQCAGHGLRTTDGRDFTLLELNRCEEEAIKAREALAAAERKAGNG